MDTKIKAKIVLDSIESTGVRLTTMELTIPRIILSELNTHRKFSRNVSSSRSISFKRMLKQIKDDPFIPLTFPARHKGMSTSEVVDYKANALIWLKARDAAASVAEELHNSGVSKQLTNRIVEPWMWTKVLLSATEFNNFFAQRISESAEQHINDLAIKMKAAMDESTPVERAIHLPYYDHEELSKENFSDLLHASVGRCARVSYLHRREFDMHEDVTLGKKIIALGHFSPTEHVAFDKLHFKGFEPSNFDGWIQYRKVIPNENKK